MTASTRYERNLPGILDDLSAGPAPEYLDDVFARTGRMRQRPGWTFPERWLPVADIARTRAFAPAPPWRLIVVALLLIALVLAALFVVGSQRKVAPPFGPARNGEIVYDSAGDLYVGEPRYRCQPVACRRSRSRTARRLLAGRYPGRVLPGCRLLSDRPSTSLRSTRMDRTCLRSRLGAARRRTRPGQLGPGQQAPGGRSMRRRGIRAYSSSSTWKAASRRSGWCRTWTSSCPAFRPPNGQEIAFRAIVDGKYGVYVMNADGTDMRTLLEPNVPLDMGTPRRQYGLLGRRRSGSSIRATRRHRAGCTEGAASCGS